MAPPLIVPVFVRRFQGWNDPIYSFSPLPQCQPILLTVPQHNPFPFCWHLAPHPDKGAVLRCATGPDIEPRAALDAAHSGTYGFGLFLSNTTGG